MKKNKQFLMPSVYQPVGYVHAHGRYRLGGQIAGVQPTTSIMEDGDTDARKK